MFQEEFMISCCWSPIPVLPLHDPVSVCGLVGPVPVIAHPPVLVIAPVAEHPGPLGDLARIYLALAHDTISATNKPPIGNHHSRLLSLLAIIFTIFFLHSLYLIE